MQPAWRRNKETNGASVPGVRHLDAGQHAGGRHAEVQVGDQLGGRGPVDPRQLPPRQLVRVQATRPRLDVHHVARFFGF